MEPASDPASMEAAPARSSSRAIILASYELRLRVDAGVVIEFLDAPLEEPEAPGAGVLGLKLVLG